jgi:hypothetical protein
MVRAHVGPLKQSESEVLERENSTLFFFALTLKLTLLIFSRNFRMNLSMLSLHPHPLSAGSIFQTFRTQNAKRGLKASFFSTIFRYRI